MKGLRHVFMDAASDGSGSGAAAGAGGAGDGGASGDAGAAGSAAGASAGDGKSTALEAGAQTVGIPEKYQVKKEDGTVDVEASSLKLAEAYGHLEKRMGSGDVPPKTPEEYQVTVPDALKDTWKPDEDPLLKEFLKDAHAAGYTQKQVDLALGKYMDLAPKLVAGSQTLSAEECVTTLKTEWKTDAEYKAGVKQAYTAAVAYFGKDADAMITEYGNDPRFIRGMAKLGGEMGEDTPPGGGDGIAKGSSVESLMSSEAYTNPRHAEHAAISKKVQAHFERQAKAAEKAGAIPLM
jgi:hypothetical protein